MHDHDERSTAQAYGRSGGTGDLPGRAGAGRRLLTLCAALAVGVAAAGCGGDDGGDSGEQAPQNGTSQQASPSGTATQAQSGGSGGPGGSSETVGQIPVYKPSMTVSEWASGTVLASRDSVAKVSKFYVDWVDKSGWDIVSKSVTPYGTSLVIKKKRKGASISVTTGTRGATTAISISVYPT